jgi:hypothetical protein
LKKPRVLLLTSTNLTCNPRCLKELKLLESLGYDVSVKAFWLNNWSAESEKKLVASLKKNIVDYIDPSRKNIFIWVWSSFLHSFCGLLSFLFPDNLYIASMAVDKKSWMLLNHLNSTQTHPPALIIAHTPSAFYPAYVYAKKIKSRFAIDIEDYHPGEESNAGKVKAISKIMARLIELSEYTSYASIQIQEYAKLALQIKSKNTLVLNNFFPKDDFQLNEIEAGEKLELVWFSQNINYGRGLELILPLFYGYEQYFNFTLIGNCIDSFAAKNIKIGKGVRLLSAMHPTELNKLVGAFDVGLAIEPGKDINNNIALSNKILTYFQAGLYIVASDTSAQRYFINQHPFHGTVFSIDRNGIINLFEFLITQKENIRKNRCQRFLNASKYNWETESAPLVQKWEEILR